MHFKNARNASVYAVFRAFFTQSLAKLRILLPFDDCVKIFLSAFYNWFFITAMVRLLSSLIAALLRERLLWPGL